MDCCLKTTAVLLILCYVIPFAASDIYCKIVDTVGEDVDEEAVKLIKSTEVPHQVHAIPMRNGREDPKAVKRIETINRLKSETIGENPEQVSGKLQEGTEKLREQYQTLLRKKKKNKKKNKKVKAKSSRRKRFTFDEEIEPNRLWPSGVVNYQYDSTLTDYEKQNIEYVMRMYEYYTPIRFVESNSGSYLSFIRGSGCWSYIGNTGRAGQQISACAQYQDISTAIHEFGHALGLYHEHQNPSAKNYVWPNDLGLPDDSWRQWFYPVSGSNYGFYDHVLDIDSPMFYGELDFTRSYANLQTLIVFEKDLKEIIGIFGDRQTLFYTYKEITQLYSDVTTSCPGLTCDCDGYPSYTDSACVCACPKGLDPATGCTTVVGDDTSGSALIWVKNVALIQTKNGCDLSKFEEGSITLSGGPSNVEFDSIYNFDAMITSGTNGVTDKDMTIHFCTRSKKGKPSMTWPKGSYCYIKDGDACDSAFQEGSKVFNNGNGFSSTGTLPSGITTSGNQTTITFCCRDDAHYSVPVVFPSDSPFVLFPSSGKCQEVKGMHASWQMVKFYNHNDISDRSPVGFVPRMNINWWYGDILLNLCYYEKIQAGCGEVYTLDSSNKQVTFTTPNFPENYNNNQQCTWVFKTDPGKVLKLEFQEFHIATDPDGMADDEVEIRNIKIGNSGKRYTGEGMLRHHISDENFLSVIFYSSHNNPAKGFSATVTLIDEEALCYTGKGENYDGKRNVSLYFTPCLNWKDAAQRGCPHEPYSIGDEYNSLDHNYCRNPGHGLRPWCFVDFEGGCQREYCDVCNLRGCFDSDNGDCDVNLHKIRFCDEMEGQCEATCKCEDGATSCVFTDARADCQELLNNVKPFCETPEGKTYCAKTCGVCDAIQAETLQTVCTPPSIPDAVIDNPKASYSLGEVVQLRCSFRNRVRTQTCSSTGEWVPKLEYVCDGQCSEGYQLIAHKCFKVIKDVFYDEGKAICESEDATIMMPKSDSNVFVTTLADLYKQYTGVVLSNFWIGLVDKDGTDAFAWEDGTPLSYTNWLFNPIVLPYECRQHLPNSIFSMRTITRTGKPCLFWNSTEVLGLTESYFPHEDNYCRAFDSGTVNLFCYKDSDGVIVKEDCEHLPYCYNEVEAFFPRNFTLSNYYYTGHLRYTNFGKSECTNWQDLSDDVVRDGDFNDGSKVSAKNYCRGLNRLWCYVSSSGAKQTCVNPGQCSNDKDRCRHRRRFFDGSFREFYDGTASTRIDGVECKQWVDTAYNWDSLFFSDGYSAAEASNFCRPLYNYRPWCIGLDDNWNYCDMDEKCCQELYTKPRDFNGQRAFTSIEEKCLRWDSPELEGLYTDADFPVDGSKSNANNYCRAPDGGEYLFCHIAGGVKRWCDVPIEENTKDCVYMDDVTNSWIPAYCDDLHSVVCENEGQAECPTGYSNVDSSCFKVHSDVSFSAGKALCTADDAVVMVHMADRTVTVNALRQQFTGLGKFWIGLTDSNSDDQFEWVDGAELTYTNWLSKPLVLPDECRKHDPNSIYSTRSITKTGKPCLFWNSAEVQNLNTYSSFADNYCRAFDRETANLFCYFDDAGQIVKEDCDHIPFCAIDADLPQTFSGPLDTYKGRLAYAHNDQDCLNWSDFDDQFTDADFIDGSKSNAKNYCRNFKKTSLDCYVGGEMKGCVDPISCSNDIQECRTYRKDFDGSRRTHYVGTLNMHEGGVECKPWINAEGYNQDWMFTGDGSVTAASNYCRPLFDAKPWCFDIEGGWGFCNIDKECCQETGYTRPADYAGQRSFAYNDKKCLRWDSVELQGLYSDQDFPVDGSVAAANNYCRAPGGRGYLFCHVAGGSEAWCDVPIDENTKDCTIYDLDSNTWIPTYCGSVYDVVCTTAEEELYSTCSDEDQEANCRDLFEANPEKCKDPSTVWGSTRCRKTCGYCSDGYPHIVNTASCTEPPQDSSVTKVTTSSSVAIGDYFEYSCAEGTVPQGSLKRGCLPDGTLTGTSLVCLDKMQVDEWTSNVTMKDRIYQAGAAPYYSHLYFSTSKSNTIQKNGFIKGWTYYSLSEASLGLYVLRRIGSENNFTVVNYTTLNVVQSNRASEVELTPPSQFAVQQNDVIGWMMAPGLESQGGIPHDTCNSTAFPDDTGDYLTFWWMSNLDQPATYSHFSPTVDENRCRVFSLAARIGPSG